MQSKNISKNMLIIAAVLIAAVGLFIRFYRVHVSEFLFYDEGMYLGYNRNFLNLVAQNPPHSIQEFFIISGLIFKNALGTAKAFWFYLINMRVFIVGPEGYYFSRIISALAGIGTVILTYLFARAYFKSQTVAVLSALILFLLPSHVFYSRLGMQESLSTLLFLSGVYAYLFSKRGVSFGLFLSAALISLVYFTNYRMIIAPVFIVCAQCFLDLTRREKIDYVKMAGFCIVFAVIIAAIGSLYGGVNNYVNFGWMLNQAGEAGQYRSLINFLSFPYYIFKLDNVIFGLFFFSGFYLIIKKKFEYLLPLLMGLLPMVLFSFAAEKGARYLCVVLPFLAMAAAYQIQFFLNVKKYKKFFGAAVMCMLAGFLFNGLRIAFEQTDYDKAVAWVLTKDPQAKILSTQPVVESLFASDDKTIVAFPKDPEQFALLLSQGYRYVIIDPQAYISWTADERRFTMPLIPPLEAIQKQLVPLVEFDNIKSALLERFVLDHNQDLPQSLTFLNTHEGRGKIYIYDLKR